MTDSHPQTTTQAATESERADWARQVSAAYDEVDRLLARNRDLSTNLEQERAKAASITTQARRHKTAARATQASLQHAEETLARIDRLTDHRVLRSALRAAGIPADQATASAVALILAEALHPASPTDEKPRLLPRDPAAEEPHTLGAQTLAGISPAVRERYGLTTASTCAGAEGDR